MIMWLSLKRVHILTGIVMILALIELLRTAWISDDAAITLRTVLNLVNGYGATFNIDERVQAYTHPLWFLLIAGATALIGNMFYVTFFLSIALSLWVYWLVITRIANHIWIVLVMSGILLLSKAYMDYSTSGLENPLSHLMLVGMIIYARQALKNQNFRDMAVALTLCMSLYLSRPDLILLGLPLYGLLLFKNHLPQGKRFQLLLISIIPVILWTLFSLFYYGFPFPNTAYAKLGAGIPIVERIPQGWLYLLDSLNRDPLTLVTIVAGTLAGLFSYGTARALAVGNSLYLAYIVSVGGDFMSGRLLTPLLLVAVILLNEVLYRQLYGKIAGVFLLGLGLLNGSTIFSNQPTIEGKAFTNGIADERRYYFPQYGLMAAPPGTFTHPEWTQTTSGLKSVCGGLGFESIRAGASMHMLDTCALAEPLLARLPAKYTREWRIGHFYRVLPVNYKASLRQNQNLLTDPEVRDYYSTLREITRAPLFDTSRLQSIIKLNLGIIKTPDFSAYRFAYSVPIELDSAELLSKTGRKQDTSLIATAETDQAGFITYGPYVALDAGTYSLEILYKSPAPQSQPIGKWDVTAWNPDALTVLEEGILYGSNQQIRKIIAPFTILPEASPHNLHEFRNWWNGQADLQIFQIRIQRQPDA